MAKSSFVTTGDLPKEVLCQTQVPLRTGQADVAEVRGQERQLGFEVGTLLEPENHAVASKGVTKVV
jgi:hypothetical protein